MAAAMTRPRRADPEDTGPVEALRRGRLRVTPQRVAVVRALAAGPHVSTCQDIWARARQRTAGLGQVTVYRILEKLEAAGVIERLDVNGTAQFGLAIRHHDHAICERCGAVSATDACLLDALPALPHGPEGFLVTRHRIDLIGLCGACQETQSAP
jgi:Fe2+ or Zn2+ uptake regulation protein